VDIQRITTAGLPPAASLVTDHLQRRTVEIRGRTEPIEVIVLRPKQKSTSARLGTEPMI
jgi:hypothetical protein